MMPTYVEFPTDLITNVHWRKKKKPSDGGPGQPPPCEIFGSYGYGAISAHTHGIISDVPYGPHQAEPFIGAIHDARGNVVAQAAPYGLAALGLVLNETSISFATTQLIELASTIPTMIPFFTVAMGVNLSGYTLDFEWHTGTGRAASSAQQGLVPQPQGAGDTALYGLDFITPSSPPFDTAHTQPLINMGAAAGLGSFTHDYDIKGGGPASVYWRWNWYPYYPQIWVDGRFAGHNIDVGDWYTWYITPFC